MRNFCFTIFLVICTNLSLIAQITALRFTGEDRIHSHLRLNKVEITNYTQGWTETIFYPDTVLILNTGTGITTLDEVSTSFSDMVPNPSYGISDINVQVVKEEHIQLSIFDVQGKKITELQQRLPAGKHTLRVYFSTPQLYLLKLTMDDIQHTFKIINISNGGQDKIEYHSANSEYSIVYEAGQGKGNSQNPFNIGDHMEYLGYATINGVEFTSVPIEQIQNQSENFTLLFDTIVITLPTVTTDTISNITSTDATGGGNVTSDGNTTVTARGVCWSRAHFPTISHSRTVDGSGFGVFTSNLTVLTPNTTYYVRAYATNSVGTAYGNEESFTTYDLPTVTTDAISNITSTDATGGGNITFDGNTTVTARGVCWSTSPAPTLSDSFTVDGNGLGVFTSSITGLTADTTYYVRAYATNSVGTAYGNEVVFTTLSPCLPITDIDGNTYQVVQLGSQCWMRENLRVTKFATGTSITLGSSTSSSTPYRYYPNGDTNKVSIYGYLYNWPAAMNGAGSSSSNPSGVQGVCPDGWHLPSKAEWTQLTNYVSSQPSYLCNSNASYIAKALAYTSGWEGAVGVCNVGVYPSLNNATGFGIVPAGYYYESYFFFHERAELWSTSVPSVTYTNTFSLEYCEPDVFMSVSYACCGLSVRCLRDE